MILGQFVESMGFCLVGLEMWIVYIMIEAKLSLASLGQHKTPQLAGANA